MPLKSTKCINSSSPNNRRNNKLNTRCNRHLHNNLSLRSNSSLLWLNNSNYSNKLSNSKLSNSRLNSKLKLKLRDASLFCSKRSKYRH
ncbi:hypothetical protein BGZ74_007794, partial [Mortierella antarctica]